MKVFYLHRQLGIYRDKEDIQHGRTGFVFFFSLNNNPHLSDQLENRF